MKQFVTLLTTLMLALNTFGQVGINTETPDSSAALDITSTTGGLLVPRMTQAQRDAISSPTQGLIIFCTNCAQGEGELQIRLTSNWKNLHDGGDVNDLIAVGDFYQGGVIFYIFQDGDTGYVPGETHGLIAAVSDQSTGIKWHNGTNIDTGATATAIGTGSANTDTIIDQQGVTVQYAARVASAYNGGGYTDWFLPSKDELNLMFLNTTAINTTATANGGSNLQTDYYWSSSESDSENAWSQYFYGIGEQYVFPKLAHTINVRAVRTF